MPLAQLTESCSRGAKHSSLEQCHCYLLTVHPRNLYSGKYVERPGGDVTGDSWNRIEPLTYQISPSLELGAHLLGVVGGVLKGLKDGVLHGIVAACGDVVLHLGQLRHCLGVRR